jgi:hypothetical protein
MVLALAIIFLKSINQSNFAVVKCCVLFEVRTEFLCIIPLQRDKLNIVVLPRPLEFR